MRKDIQEGEGRREKKKVRKGLTKKKESDEWGQRRLKELRDEEGGALLLSHCLWRGGAVL